MIFFAVFLGICLMVWILLNAWRPRSFSPLLEGRRKPLLLGHRGAAGEAPENSMLAFQAAALAKADGVELDVMMTADRQLVVFHDYRLQKRLPLQGEVRKMTLAELRSKVDLAEYYARLTRKPIPPAFRKTPVPLFEDVLAYYQKHPQIVVNIELKNEDLRDQGHEAEAIRLVKKYKMEDRVFASSFNPFSIWRFRRIAPHIRTGLIYDNSLKIYLRRLWLLPFARPDALCPNYRIVDEAYMRWARSQGFAVHVWTVNHPEEMRRLIRLGVDGIMTDHPTLLVRIYEEEQAKKTPATSRKSPTP
jgi:glycerophosphoryl diester phosphodiesterase